MQMLLTDFEQRVASSKCVAVNLHITYSCITRTHNRPLNQSKRDDVKTAIQMKYK